MNYKLKNKNIKLSIIIPVFNTNRFYLNRLEKSINRNKFKEKIEVVFIDDGSTNIETLKTLERYSKRYNVIHHDKNKGLGPTRNTGFKNSIGEFIWFIDSDDYISDNAIEKIFKIIDYNNEIDFISINYFNIIDNKFVPNDSTNYNFIYKDIIVYGFATVWSKIFNRNFLLINNIYHHDSNLYHEDEFFTLNIMLYAKKIISVESKLYFYDRTNLSSITNTIKERESFLNLMELLESFFSKIDWKNVIDNELFIRYSSKFKYTEISFARNNIIKFMEFYRFWKILFPLKKINNNFVFKNIFFCLFIYILVLFIRVLK